MKKSDVLADFFMGARSNLLDIAAFLDRLERSSGDEDYRAAAFRACIPILSDKTPEKARRILELLSDPSEEPISEAHEKGASGAWPDFK